MKSIEEYLAMNKCVCCLPFLGYGSYDSSSLFHSTPKNKVDNIIIFMYLSNFPGLEIKKKSKSPFGDFQTKNGHLSDESCQNGN